LRNYEELPGKVGNDLDIWVAEDQQQQFQGIVKKISEELGWKFVAFLPRPSFKGEGDYFFLRDNKDLNIIHLDCWTKLTWRGIEYVDSSEFYKNLLYHERGFYSPKKGLEAAIMLIKNLVYHRKVQEKYKDQIAAYANDDPKSFFDVLKSPLGIENATYLLNAARDKQWESLENKSPSFRMSLLKRLIARNPLSQIKAWIFYSFWQFHKFILPGYGIFVILIGPDGSGKSTTSNHLINGEIKKLFQKKSYFHGHFSYLPELKKIALIFSDSRKKLTVESQVPDLQLKPFGVFRAMLYPLYYGIDYFLGHFFIWKEKARGGLIVFDRYFYDYMLQKPYENCPRWLINIVAKIIPKPDILIYLKNNPETIYIRKPELPVEEIARQSKICDEIIKRSRNGFVIETSLSQDEVVKRIQRIIVDKIKQKAKRL
jgi:thymidylate kinase